MAGAASATRLLAFACSHSRFPDNDGILDSIVEILSLTPPLFDLHHQLLKVDWDVLTIYIDLIDSLERHELHLSEAFDSSLPLLGLVELLLEDDHLLGDIAVRLLLLMEFNQFAHSQLLVHRNMLGTLRRASLDVALLLDLLRKFEALLDLVFDVWRCGHSDLLKSSEMISQLFVIDPI